MIIDSLLLIAYTLFALFLLGYAFTVIKEKYYLSNQIIFLDYKNLEPEDLNRVDIKHFMLGTIEIMAGDEVKVLLENSARIKGTVLGVIKKENSISIISPQGVKNLKVNSIKKLKIISRYGKFFNYF
ncbi:hypothetical protein [Alkaliphilus peptidifermentans]|uniref:Uncharacterized protein n=1 Tax=Alkaliphilus peptidifermentans DSM 18978 TaxID=1120976 RepID=A0A1G5BAU0_9FIRM|nr:hypothetical protein [Alkaliphilus peptidifermentans]SCX87223.1 hypothetical protein SAMN03080606_00353 [Alkaliphilus peptidifermentans DSM 18978]